MNVWKMEDGKERKGSARAVASVGAQATPSQRASASKRILDLQICRHMIPGEERFRRRFRRRERMGKAYCLNLKPKSETQNNVLNLEP